MWKQGHLEQLLVHVEEQCRTRLEMRRLQKCVKSQTPVRRAKLLVEEGVFSKAAKGLTGEAATLNADEQVRGREGVHARGKLIAVPNVNRTETACKSLFH